MVVTVTTHSLVRLATILFLAAMVTTQFLDQPTLTPCMAKMGMILFLAVTKSILSSVEMVSTKFMALLVTIFFRPVMVVLQEPRALTTQI